MTMSDTSLNLLTHCRSAHGHELTRALAMPTTASP
jgi:hypothetical protein